MKPSASMLQLRETRDAVRTDTSVSRTFSNSTLPRTAQLRSSQEESLPVTSECAGHSLSSTLLVVPPCLSIDSLEPSESMPQPSRSFPFTLVLWLLTTRLNHLLKLPTQLLKTPNSPRFKHFKLKRWLEEKLILELQSLTQALLDPTLSPMVSLLKKALNQSSLHQLRPTLMDKPPLPLPPQVHHPALQHLPLLTDQMSRLEPTRHTLSSPPVKPLITLRT